MTDTGSIAIQRNDEAMLRIVMAGEVDLAVVTDEVRESVATSNARAAVMDLSSVTFMDSIAIALLVQMRNQTRTRPTLVGVGVNVAALLAMAGLLHLFDQVPAE